MLEKARGILANNIDLVVHGFSNNEDWDKQKDFFEYLINENKFEKIDYYNKTSTTDILIVSKPNTNYILLLLMFCVALYQQVSHNSLSYAK